MANGVAVGQQSTGLSDISAQVQQYQQFLGESRWAGQCSLPQGSQRVHGGVWWIFRLAYFCLMGLFQPQKPSSKISQTHFGGLLGFFCLLFFSVRVSLYSSG